MRRTYSEPCRFCRIYAQSTARTNGSYAKKRRVLCRTLPFRAVCCVYGTIFLTRNGTIAQYGGESERHGTEVVRVVSNGQAYNSKVFLTN